MRFSFMSPRPLLVAAYVVRSVPPDPVVLHYLCNIISWQYYNLSHPDTVFRSRGQRVTTLSVPVFKQR